MQKCYLCIFLELAVFKDQLSITVSILKELQFVRKINESQVRVILQEPADCNFCCTTPFPFLSPELSSSFSQNSLKFLFFWVQNLCAYSLPKGEIVSGKLEQECFCWFKCENSGMGGNVA